jgi:predicted  nucleic acid-binding Zn-ribbon protein
MATLDAAGQRLNAALEALESAVLPLAEARAQAARQAGEIARLTEERERLLARIAELEEETRALANLTEDAETRIDGAIAEIRVALGH